MTDESGVDTPGDEATAPVTDADLERARAELRELGEHMEERLASFDVRDAGEATVEQRSLFMDAVRTFSHNRLAVFSSIVMIVFIVLAIFVPLDKGWNPLYSHANIDPTYENINAKPSLRHPFGTDPAGKDLWKRVWIGARVSLSIAIAVALVILIIGVIYGAISGYVGGKLDNAMMRVLDSLYGLPYLPFAIITVAIVRAHFPHAGPLLYMVPALSITAWFTQARVTRGLVLSLKENDFVESARASGAGWARIISRHILPNTIGITIVAIALEIPGAILGEATLSYLGLGVTSPDTSWGRLAIEGSDYFRIQPHILWAPALMIAITVLCAVAIADGLRDALDPRGKQN